MTYSILSFANFSHGDLVSVGAFSGWGVAFLIAGFGEVPVRTLLTVRDAGNASPGDIGAHILTTPGAILVGLLAAFAVTAVLAVALDRAFYKPMRDRDGISLLIASIGAALIVRYLLQFIYGSDRRGITASVDASNIAFDPLGLSVDAHELTILVAALGLMLAMHGMLQHTKLGTAMRAMPTTRIWRFSPVSRPNASSPPRGSSAAGSRAPQDTSTSCSAGRSSSTSAGSSSC
jgi:branched-chain amino acid transport system permease protein